MGTDYIIVSKPAYIYFDCPHCHEEDGDGAWVDCPNCGKEVELDEYEYD